MVAGAGSAITGSPAAQPAHRRELQTPHGPAAVHLHAADSPRAAIVLGHGAGGGVGAPDLVAVTAVALELRIAVALVEQPYRVAGRRSPAPAAQLDSAWTSVVAELRGDELRGLPLIVGGRSSGARVACRTATATEAIAVLCLAFPLLPPRRASAKPAQSRLGELEQVTAPVLIVQGEGDPFGIPPAAGQRQVIVIRGNHSLRSDADGLRSAVAAWLTALLP